MLLIIANDKRMQYLADGLADFFPVAKYSKDFTNFNAVKYVVLPFKIDYDEIIGLLNRLPDDCTIFTPIMRPFLEGVPQQIEIIMDYDEIAIYNSIPTSEGTIYYIMKNTETTIHGAKIHIIGAGRCGETLAKNLRSLGADVSISTRNPRLEARLFETRIRIVKTDADSLSEADVIINTVPAMMLGADQLQHVKPGTYIADIASAPGGVDFEAATKLGVKAELLPALPGIVAPKTAATYLMQFIKRKIGS